MPLGFNTKSHGEIPVGFFNIESDMILMLDQFMFASDFCKWLSEWASGPDDLEKEYPMWVIDDGQKIGDLHGAISGTSYTGFIGELYKKWPFPEAKEDFKQNPEGYKTREEVEAIVKDFSPVKNVIVKFSKDEGTISIGEFVFLPEDFHQVILYVWQGGWPKYRDDIKPDYVTEMMKAVVASEHWLFKMGQP
jgi:hypothetical protein